MMSGKSEVLLHLFTTRRTNGKFQLVINNSDHFTLWGLSHWDTWVG